MIHEELMKPGRWDLRFHKDTPDTIRSAMVERGHIVVVKNDFDPTAFSDTDILSMSQYTGRLLTREKGRAGVSEMMLGGDHVTAWLGDADGRGEIITVLQSYTNTAWSTFIAGVLPSSLSTGTVTNNPSNVNADYFGMTPRAAIEHAAELSDAEYRVNNDGTFDSGTEADLYAATPAVFVIRKSSGFDDEITTLESPDMRTVVDASEWVSEVHIAGTADAAAGSADIIIGTADLADIAKSNPYKDLQGNADATAELVQDPISFADQGDPRAQVLLGDKSLLRETITFSVAGFEVEGDIVVGAKAWVYDPPDISDTGVVLDHAGQTIHPKQIRIFGLSWPVIEGKGVFYRDLNGNYTWLTPYLIPEQGSSKVTIGDLQRSPWDTGQSAGASAIGAINNPPNAITTPDVPTKANLPWTSTAYQDVNGNTFAQVLVDWTEPNNTDGSPITDGSHYMVRYRLDGETNYQYVAVDWSITELLLQGLIVGGTYDISIAAYDFGGNSNGYGTDETMTMVNDTVPPSQPAAPDYVAGSPLNVMVVHRLGKNAGGTFNLESDTAKLDVYVGTSAAFTPSKGNDEVQEVYNDATGGTFTLTFDGQTTLAIPYDSGTGILESRLEALTNLFDVTVTGAGTSGDPWIVTFHNPFGNVPQMTADDTNLTGHTDGTTITTTTEGGSGGNFVGSIDVQPGNLALEIPVSGTFPYGNRSRQEVYNDATGGTFTLTFDGNETGDIAYNAAASTVETELEALDPGINATVSGAGTSGDPWIITFEEPIGTQPLLVADDTNLTGHTDGTTITEDKDSDSRYVKVVAVDYAGNDSTASPETTVTVELIDSIHLGNAIIGNAEIQDLAVTNAKIADATIQSAKIASLEADKITAGTLSVSVLIDSSGVIRTASTGNYRVEIGGTTADSIRWYLSSDTLYGEISITVDGFEIEAGSGTGSLWLNGGLIHVNGEARMYADVIMYGATSRLEWDSNTYIDSPALDQIRIVCGGISMVTFIEGTNDQVRFDRSGNAAAPAITIAGVLNTGIYGTSSTLQFSTSGARRVWMGNNADYQLYVDGKARFTSSGTAASPTIQVGNINTGFYRVSNTEMRMTINGASAIATTTTKHGPTTNNQWASGSSGLAWDDVFGVNAYTETSDARVKKGVAPLADLIPDPIEFVRQLGVKRFKKYEGSRWHTGWLAQDLKAVMDTRGIDFGAFVHSKYAEPDTDVMAIRGSELVAVLWAAVQELSEQVEVLSGG